MKILETSRLILREFVPTDVNGLELLLSDPETMRFYPARLERAEVEPWIARNLERYRRNGHGLWAMVLKSGGELVRDCGLTLQQVDGGNEVEIGYHVRRDLWGQGLATEAARACRDFGFALIEEFSRFRIMRGYKVVQVAKAGNQPNDVTLSGHVILRCRGHREQQAAQRLRQNFHLEQTS